MITRGYASNSHDPWRHSVGVAVCVQHYSPTFSRTTTISTFSCLVEIPGKLKLCTTFAYMPSAFLSSMLTEGRVPLPTPVTNSPFKPTPFLRRLHRRGCKCSEEEDRDATLLLNRYVERNLRARTLKIHTAQQGEYSSRRAVITADKEPTDALTWLGPQE